MARPGNEVVKDETDSKHSVDDAKAGVPDPMTGQRRTADAPTGDRKEAQDNSAARRAERTGDVEVQAELTNGVDPFTGGELSVEEAQAHGWPVMVPESKGDIRRDVTMPSHIQAPPVEQVAPGELSKANSSTSQRNAARRKD